MAQKWTTTKLIATGGLAVVWIVLGMLGFALNAVTGIVGVGGVINISVGGFICVLCCFLIRKFGGATLMGLIYGILALPLPAMGTPGFFPKILIGLATGLSADILYQVLKNYERLASVIIALGINLVAGFSILGLTLLFSIPGANKMGKMWLSPFGVVACLVLAIVGGYIALLVYRKLQNTSVIKRIQA